jgi:hypothetical protein
MPPAASAQKVAKRELRPDDLAEIAGDFHDWLVMGKKRVDVTNNHVLFSTWNIYLRNRSWWIEKRFGPVIDQHNRDASSLAAVERGLSGSFFDFGSDDPATITIDAPYEEIPA